MVNTMVSKVYSITDEEFKTIVNTSHSYSDCLRKLGLKTGGGSSTDLLKKRINDLCCDISHFGNQNNNCNARHKLEDILVSNSTYMNISRLKIRLVNAGLLEYKCAKCGNGGNWLGDKLVLELDHIDGVYNNHQLHNLRFLCPNCHSQTKTYTGRNKKLN